MSIEDYVAILSELKPAFIHHPTAKVAIPEMLSALGCDLEKTYFDVPRLRTMAHGEYLKAGLALQFHPHRDTWFSAPQQQINWWLPVTRSKAGTLWDSMFTTSTPPLQNSSADYDYDEWTRTGRKQAGQNVTTKTRKQPQPHEEFDLSSEVRVVTPVAGVLIFSAAHLHATVPNMTSRTRF